MEKRLVLEDNNGTVLRAFNWTGESGEVIRRGDTKRLEIVPSTEHLSKKKIPFEKLGQVTKQDLANKPFLVGRLGHLKLVEEVGMTLKDHKEDAETQRRWYMILAALMLFTVLFMSYVRTLPTMTAKMEQNLKQEVVKIIKSIPPKPKVEMQKVVNQNQETTPTKTVTKTTNTLKRMGALAVLGSLSKGKQKGGVDLGAVNTSAGPGLGGTQGSGGVQTSLYGKGVVAAPVGVGGNIQGAGGYGTKGKGGGQAGYGKLSLVGSAGTSSMALAQEATVASGLDRDAIAAVINRNLGQVRFCYEQGLQGDPNLNGRVAIAFTIGGNGAVKVASVDNTTINSKAIEDCIVMRLKTWQFPLPQGGVDVKVSYPFVLRRAGQG
ncbi:AgmX/PglI C-terminal domain-containing protein [Bdellovibrio sp. HCB337]|uniref:AgmX/PglI C-terminal domain-containing protein n=1 Tax=Bdellovibrio sp. HCB337 TaxID=3394358 RepID=UPI0039A50021